MRFTIISLFPKYFESPFSVSMIKRAREKKLIEIDLVDIRDFGEGTYKQVDDRVYGGGPGMVLMALPVLKAIRSAKRPTSRVIYLSPQGSRLTAKRCEALACEESHLVLLCGHYEGIDERVLEIAVDEEISIGDYVLTSGAPAATVLVDAISRFIPGVIGNEEAPQRDSFSDGVFDAPVYTRPSEVEGREVPAVLRCGHHGAIAHWRREKALKKTSQVRPDLVEELENFERKEIES
ncbi:MAG: tRNA (guanosine(37)-N1)-methyltransferase TrmD [Chlamydiota bacterium]